MKRHCKVLKDPWLKAKKPPLNQCLFFSKQIILPLFIKKGHNDYIIQSIFPQPVLCKQRLRKQIYVFFLPILTTANCRNI